MHTEADCQEAYRGLAVILLVVGRSGACWVEHPKVVYVVADCRWGARRRRLVAASGTAG